MSQPEGGKGTCEPARTDTLDTVGLQTPWYLGSVNKSGDCPARSSTAHLAVASERGGAGAAHGAGHHRVDPHKLSATIEVVDEHESVLATGRYSTDKAGYAAMRKTMSRWAERVWAVEGGNGAARAGI